MAPVVLSTCAPRRSGVRTARLLEVPPLKMKRALSISYLILPLLALFSAHDSNAQTIIVDKTTLTFSGQVGGAAVSQTVNVTSSTGAAVPFALIVPSGNNWLKVGELPIFSGVTPATVTISADPTGLSAGTYPASPPALISVQGGASTNNTPIGVTFNVSTIGVSPQSLTFSYTVNSNNFPVPQNITLNSTAATQCTATAATTGGSWVGPLQNPCVSPGNVTVQLNSSVVTGLAAGTYTGTITITPSAGQGPAAVVPDNTYGAADSAGHSKPRVAGLELADRHCGTQPQPDIHHHHYRQSATGFQLHTERQPDQHIHYQPG